MKFLKKCITFCYKNLTRFQWILMLSVIEWACLLLELSLPATVPTLRAPPAPVPLSLFPALVSHIYTSARSEVCLWNSNYYHQQLCPRQFSLFSISTSSSKILPGIVTHKILGPWETLLRHLKSPPFKTHKLQDESIKVNHTKQKAIQII